MISSLYAPLVHHEIPDFDLTVKNHMVSSFRVQSIIGATLMRHIGLTC